MALKSLKLAEKIKGLLRIPLKSPILKQTKQSN